MIYEDFSYTFKWVDDGAYGYKNKETGEWNGLMGELLSQVRAVGLGVHGIHRVGSWNSPTKYNMAFEEILVQACSAICLSSCSTLPLFLGW